MNKTKKSVSSGKATRSKKAVCSLPCEYFVNESELLRIRKQAGEILTGCSQDTLRLVHNYLNLTEGADAMMINAWRRCGRNDMGRAYNLTLNEVARRTMTPLGLACLYAYAVSFIDEAEVRLAARSRTGTSDK